MNLEDGDGVIEDDKYVYRETETLQNGIQDHFLNQLSRSNFLGGGTYTPKAEETVDGKKKLYCCMNVYQIESIDGAESRFSCKLRLYLVFQLDYEVYPKIKETYLEKAEPVDYYSLTEGEVAHIMETNPVLFPTIKFFNASEVIPDGGNSIRIYAGENGGYIMWNYGIRAIFKETFEFENFPFDTQRLNIHIQQDDSRNWDHYDLTVCCVLLHYDALDQPEYHVLEPIVKRGSPAHKASFVSLFVSRKSG